MRLLLVLKFAAFYFQRHGVLRTQVVPILNKCILELLHEAVDLANILRINWLICSIRVLRMEFVDIHGFPFERRAE